MPYMVYLYDGLAASSPLNRITLSSQDQNTVQQTLKSYFDQIVTAHDKLGRQGQVHYGTSIVQWIQPPFPPIHVHELLVYLVPPGTTVVTHGKLEQGTAASNHGNTHAIPNPPGTSGSTWGSEVWPLFNSTPGGLKVFAGLIFHETMHNKLALNNPQLHNQGGLATGPPEAPAIDENTNLSPDNIRVMASALDTPRPQWTAGLDMLAKKAGVPDSDPSKGMWN